MSALARSGQRVTPEARKDKRRAKRRAQTVRAQGILQGVCAMLRPGDVTFDCGANVGAVSHALAATGATLHAYEPDPVAFAALEARVGGPAHVHLHAACVGLSAGTAHLARATNFDGDPERRTQRSTVLRGGAGMDDTQTLDVPQVDLLKTLRETLDASGKIAFLKLDIEGAELDILEAMEQADLFDHVRLTVAELHPGKFPDLKPRFKALRARIAARYAPSHVYLDWI